MTVLRGKSNDTPKLTMRIENGFMVPVSAWDFELMSQWRNGAVVEATLTRPVQRPLERKYFAMLSKLIKEYETPWSNMETAHEALKLNAGFVDPYKRKTGKWGVHPRSIVTFSDQELDEYFEIFCGVVRDRFGIDPEDLRREAPDVGSESPDVGQRPGVGDGPGAHPIPVGVGEPSSATTYPPVADGPEAGGDTLDLIPRDVSSSADGPKLTNEEWDWLKTTARMLVSATEPNGDVGIVDRQVVAIKQHPASASISPEAKTIAQLIYRHCRAVTKGDRPLDEKWVTYLARCTIADLRPEAR